MDFPLFHLDLLGNRLLIAVIASLHVMINHALAVGAVPLIVLLEWWGVRSGDRRWDDLARRLLLVCFIVTTSAGALTGVGIWLSASLINPQAIGSLIRVFFWAWFAEWIVFVTEVALILAYYLTWQGWGQRHKRGHIALGAGLSLVSWATMAIIVAILSFQMDTGVWTVQPGLRSALLNPLYLPQLIFRTPFAMVAAGLFGLTMTYFFARRDHDLRARAVRFVSLWTLAWSVVWLYGAVAYWQAVPQALRVSLPVALGTLQFERHHEFLAYLIVAAAAASLMVAAWGVRAPRRLPAFILLVPCALGFWLLGYFERVREFIRKPDVIASYMYSNAIRHGEYALLREEGLLSHAPYAAVKGVTEANRVTAGREVFRLACSRCHTTGGLNGVVAKLERMYGGGVWDPSAIDSYLAGMHNARPFMPPLPGSDAERGALVAYLLALRERPERLPGAQTAGFTLAPPVSATKSPTAPQPRDIALPLPADPIVLQALLVVLFLVHILFVNLMVGGTLIALGLEFAGRRRPALDALAHEIVATVTVNKSLAVVLGVGPLLAINVLYTIFFYTANALTGAVWIQIVPLVTVAFLAAYAHKYTWERLAKRKSLHIALGGVAAALFLAVPLIFLSNINLMLFPERWVQARGFMSALLLPNALPRYLHFLLACVAVSSLFLLWWLTRMGGQPAKRLPGLERVDLRRLFYRIALYASLGQLVAGPLVAFTLPPEGWSGRLWLIVGVGITLGVSAMALMGREVVARDVRVGRFFPLVVLLITGTAFAMGTARHVYRENAVARHRQEMAQRTSDFGWQVAAAQWRGATGTGQVNIPVGQKIFTSTCAACHAVDRVLVGPSLTEIAALYAGNPEGIARWAAAPGRKRPGMPVMPAFKLGDEKLRAVAEYMLELAVPKQGS